MVEIDGQRINEYANSMFRCEQLSEPWIASCAAYLRSLFGDDLYGKTIIDYAFGRGNWSLAFRAAGAKKVIAIEASSDSVNRFRGYCQGHNISGIEVLHGNVLEQDLSAKGDLLWLYGILPIIQDPTGFLNRVKSLASGPEAQLYVYHYNAKSLREFTVQTCRRVLVYETEDEFRKDSYLFVRPARMRARDDLTAATVMFSTAAELKTRLGSCGIYVQRQDSDFQQFLHGNATEDFYPHQFLCGLAQGDAPIIEPPAFYRTEIEVLAGIADEVLTLPFTPTKRKNIAIGLYNTHFAFLNEEGGASKSVIEIFLFLMYVLLENEVMDSAVSPAVAPYYSLFRAAISGADRAHGLRFFSGYSRGSGENRLIEYLINHNVRS